MGNKKVHLDADPILESNGVAGATAGFGNTDIANLLIDALDMKNGWADFPARRRGSRRRRGLRDWCGCQGRHRQASIAASTRPTAGSTSPIGKRQDGAHSGETNRRGRRQPKASKGDPNPARPGTPVDAISPRFRKLLCRLCGHPHRIALSSIARRPGAGLPAIKLPSTL